MKHIELEECGKKISTKDIASFEAFLGLELPTDYKDFLIECNGGYPVDELTFPIENDESVLSHFYCIGEEEGDILSLRECWDSFVATKRISGTYLPIADDAFGNQLCLDLSVKEFGAIVFWDHESDSGRIIKVASSFADLCKKLQPLLE